jgi:DNA-binding transcriptional ArsR family regulator
MARAATTSDVFNAVGDASRRAVIDVLVGGERSVGEIAAGLHLTQPQASKHLKVLGQVDVVRSRVDGRRHLYRIHADGLRPLATWLSTFESLWNDRFDRMDDLITDIQGSTPVNEGDPR